MDLDRYVPRTLDFSTVFNLRDLGGHATTDGHRVRTGVLYRADALFRLAGADLERFAALNIRGVLDLRRPDELASDGRVPELPGMLYHNVNLQQNNWTSAVVSADQMAGYLADRYTEMADEALASGAMAAALSFLVSSPGPTIFHCMAGKDRTGVVAALTLVLLGVPDETVAADYAASQWSEGRYLAWRAAARPDLPDLPAPGNSCPPEAILTFLDRLRAQYGSVAGYVERTGLDGEFRDELRGRLLGDG